ncbi:putative wing apart-like protein [Medicago truncatula]|uniref:Putative wing apart-like protein n=1 Tax=Medicago truncatula TaxID=3880 RepID=A0A072UNY9_MEDTR|nr:wings apart-like protein 2 [Medicago truncatula]KEH31101.1 WAPL (wings apart-like protein regulation of heterochromatin) protein, putative [Medicago truncatula]RHN62457.1 putative wing apart-like protein [Medicago truncatula]
MIVRTYNRRKPSITGTYSSSSLNDDVSDSLSLSQSQSQDPLYPDFAFSSQDSSSQWSFFDSDPNSIDDFGYGCRREPKRAKNASTKNGFSYPATSTLMEAQEFGEMMEQNDEVNFALDGLRKGQPIRIRRASLVSLLSICATTQQRRLLRSQGMAKTIVDGILGLSLDDSPSNLAAATLFYILTSDGQDDHLLESPCCVKFLIKLLRPIVSTTMKDKAPSLGSKLLSLRQNDDMLKKTTSKFDSSSIAVFSRVQEVLINCKELKATCQNNSQIERPELCPKWLTLLTMEKACLSAISLDETSGAVRKTGGNFKEKLREHGGLDAVFDVTMNCHSDLKNWKDYSSLSTKDLRNEKRLKSLTLLLKCLKIMENATFLSKDNQTHLLGMKGKLSPKATPLSFTELIIIVIKMLSDLCLRRSASPVSVDNKLNDPYIMVSDDSELDQLRDYKENKPISISSSRSYNGLERASSIKNSNLSHNTQLLTCARLERSLSVSETPSTSTTDTYSLKMRINSSTSGSCSSLSKSSYCKKPMTQNSSRKNVHFTEGASVVVLEDSHDPFAFDEDDSGISKSSYCKKSMTQNSSRKNVQFMKGTPVVILEDSQDPYAFDEDDSGLSKSSFCKKSTSLSSSRKNVHFTERTPVVILEDSQDPFAFDEDDIAPSKWDLLSGKQNTTHSKKHKDANREFENERQSQTKMIQEELSDGNINCSSSDISYEDSSLLTDCLLTAVKVLMNLTNDNPIGCQLIATHGGLEAMSMLIAGHFPSFSSPSSFAQIKENPLRTEKDHLCDRHLTDHELDFLVAILGLLVNLVEKDGRNRSRLAAASVLLPSSEGLDQEVRRDVIQLLCSIFLANQGESEAGAGEDKKFELNDPAAVLQGEKEAEKMIVEAYSALLLAFLSTESKSIRVAIADNLPDHNLASLVPVLDRFVEFHLSLDMISPETHKTVSEVIESCRIR